MLGRLGITIVCFHISAALYVLLGIGLAIFFGFIATQPASPEEYSIAVQPLGIFLGVFTLIFSFLLAAGVEVVVWGLRKLKYWAWIVGIVICALYITSAFVILGGLGLWGLLDSDTQAASRAARQ
ncbi:MAG: hypothetical protein HC879_18150 [Leptolyngbyaceae cyanobacterium SL_5_9]|nr:hypothetical protein [Leptolyngbyaceae cyanobacterium SL_5_9]NJO73833.1 hypothetical protein [Leptolyngbyaceae cyanobacterium RM1_406_9]